jgi:hypothetical protein
MSPRAAWNWTFTGWVLFTVSAAFFTVGAVRDGGLIELAASLSFLLACVMFIIPAIADRPRDD